MYAVRVSAMCWACLTVAVLPVYDSIMGHTVTCRGAVCKQSPLFMLYKPCTQQKVLLHGGRTNLCSSCRGGVVSFCMVGGLCYVSGGVCFAVASLYASAWWCYVLMLVMAHAPAFGWYSLHVCMPPFVVDGFLHRGLSPRWVSLLRGWLRLAS